MNRLRKNKIQPMTFMIAFAGYVVFLFWRCRFGMANLDECFYITEPYRFWQGDAMMIHEWNMVQLYAFLTIPLVSIHMAIIGNTDGIIMTFRYAFILLSIVAALYTYYQLKKIDKAGWGSSLAALVLVSFTPVGINSLSYNSMGVLFLAMAFASFLTAERRETVKLAFTGFCLACAVLCCPFLTILYVIYSVSAFLPKRTRCDEIFGFIPWIKITAGILVLAIPFLCFVFRRTTIAELLRVLPYLFIDDAHDIPAATKFAQFFLDPIDKYDCEWEIASCFIFMVFGACMKWKKKPYYAAAFFALCSVSVLISILKTYQFVLFISLMPMPLNFLVLSAWVILPRDDRIQKLFWRYWLPSLIYVICLYLASNLGALSVSTASIVALMGGIPMITIAVESLKASDNAGKALSCLTRAVAYAAILALVVCQTGMRYRYQYWDSDIDMQTTYVDYGPLKGSIICPWREEDYRLRYASVMEVEEKYKPKSAFFVTDDYQVLYYLFGNVETAGSSSWTGDGDFGGKVTSYWEMFPDKRPDMVYISKGLDREFLSWLIESEDYSMDDSRNEADVFIRKGLRIER